MDLMEKVKGIVKGPDDFEKGLPVIESVLESRDTDDMCREYFLVTELALMMHDHLSKVGDRDLHLRRQIEIHRRLLANPYTYVNPHARISSEFRIKHLELRLQGIERRTVDKEEAVGDA